MTGDDKNDKDLDNYLQDSDGILREYRHHADETPPEHLDAAILAASRKAVGSGPRKNMAPFSGWYVPVSIAAVMVLSVLVVFNIPEEELVYSQAPLMEPDAASDMGSGGAGAELPQLDKALTEEIAEAAGAVIPDLDMAGDTATVPTAPPAFRAEAFVDEAAEAISSGGQPQADVLEPSRRVLLRAMVPRVEQEMVDQDITKSPAAMPDDMSEDTITECTIPRPEFCTEQYEPVCAVRDTGIRCVTTPCDSTERVEYGNACSACSDPVVSAYTEGTCE